MTQVKHKEPEPTLNLRVKLSQPESVGAVVLTLRHEVTEAVISVWGPSVEAVVVLKVKLAVAKGVRRLVALWSPVWEDRREKILRSPTRSRGY